MSKYLKLILWIFIYLAVSFGLGYLTQDNVQGWYQILNKPSFNPPNWIFPVMWTFLYVLIAAAGWNLWQRHSDPKLKVLFILYTLLNWTWTPIFFGLEQIFIGFIWITLINVITVSFITAAWSKASLSAYLMIPPLLWTLFAAVLNYYIWALND